MPKTVVERAQHRAMLRSSAFSDWLDSALLTIIKRPGENSPPHMTLTGFAAGHFARVPLDFVIAAATFAGHRDGLPFRVNRRQIRDGLGRLVSLGAIEYIYEPPPPPPTAWTTQQYRTMIALTPPARLVALERERAQQARAHAKGRGKTFYRAVGLLDAIARAAQ